MTVMSQKKTIDSDVTKTVDNDVTKTVDSDVPNKNC